MHLFRRYVDLHQAATRAGSAADLTVASRLLRDSSHRFLSAPNTDLPGLMATAPSVALTHDNELWGIAIASWPVDDTAWLRGLALDNRVLVNAGLDLLIPPLHATLRARGVRRLFYAGDISADSWLQRQLVSLGYVRDTDVVVYEKLGYAIPSRGNMDIRLRRAQAVDLTTVLALDHACFAAQWVKDESIFGPALVDLPFFMIAELDDQPAGYAFATSHFNGRLIHLVRIAVHPAFQGRQVGVRLLTELVGFARVKGADTMTLNTQSENHTAQRLYEWFGFRRTGERQTVLRCDM